MDFLPPIFSLESFFLIFLSQFATPSARMDALLVTLHSVATRNAWVVVPGKTRPIALLVNMSLIEGTVILVARTLLVNKYNTR